MPEIQQVLCQAVNLSVAARKELARLNHRLPTSFDKTRKLAMWFTFHLPPNDKVEPKILSTIKTALKKSGFLEPKTNPRFCAFKVAADLMSVSDHPEKPILSPQRIIELHEFTVELASAAFHTYYDLHQS